MLEGLPSWADLALAASVYRDAIVCSAIAGAFLGYLSVFVIVRRMVFVSAALTQSAGMGVALAFFGDIYFHAVLDPIGFHAIEPLVRWSTHPNVGALAVSLGAAAVMALPVQRIRLSRETLLAVVFLTGSAGAIVLGQFILQEQHDVSAILFGTAVLVRPADLALVAATALVGSGLALALHRGWVFAGFDPEGAAVQRVPVRALELAFLGLLTVVVSVATRAVGALPVFAYSVLPGMAALMGTRRLGTAFPVAILLGGGFGALGYLAAIVLDFPVGATQALFAVAVVVLAVPVRLVRGE